MSGAFGASASTAETHVSAMVSSGRRLYGLRYLRWAGQAMGSSAATSPLQPIATLQPNTTQTPHTPRVTLRMMFLHSTVATVFQSW